MRMSAEVRYAAGVPAVAAILADPEFIDAKLRGAGATPQQVSVTPIVDGQTTISVRSLIATAGIPAQFRSLVGSHLDVRQTEVWEDSGGGARRATMAVEIAGAPVRMNGTITLVPAGDGACLETFDGLVKASVPLFAASIEKAIAAALREAVKAEERTALDWLARH